MRRDLQIGTQVPLTYASAVNAALRRALTEDRRCIMFGREVEAVVPISAETRDLHEEFGNRMFDSSISETAMLGTALGSLMDGLRPIVEMFSNDFTTMAMDQIVTHIAETRSASPGRRTAPMVVRVQLRLLPEACGQRPTNFMAPFAHPTGLQIGVVATVQDAYSMLLAAVGSEDPILLIENQSVHHETDPQITVGGFAESIGGARVRRNGTDLTLLCWGAVQFHVIQAAEILAAEGIYAEVIDARWLNPFDWDSLFASVRKTRRLAIVYEANVVAGFDAEIAARVQEELFHTIGEPVARVGIRDLEILKQPSPMAVVHPSVQNIVDRARSLARVM